MLERLSNVLVGRQLLPVGIAGSIADHVRRQLAGT